MARRPGCTSGFGRIATGRDTKVLLTVNEWYRGGTGSELSVALTNPYQRGGQEDPHPIYGIGTRLLLSGARSESGLVAWSCGFTRYYDAKTATEWSSVFR